MGKLLVILSCLLIVNGCNSEDNFTENEAPLQAQYVGENLSVVEGEKLSALADNAFNETSSAVAGDTNMASAKTQD